VVEDPSHFLEIKALKPGDYVTARVKRFLGQDDVWELKHKGATLQSYQNTYLYNSRRNQRAAVWALWLGFASSLSLTAAFALRIYFGTWRDPAAMDPATKNEDELPAWENQASSSPVMQSTEFGGWQDSAALSPAAQNGSAESEPGQPWQWTVKK
jgi:hypothetical protein